MASFKKLRLAVRISQNDLARKSGVSRWRVWAAEQGDCALTADEESRIGDALRREAARIRGVFKEIDAASGEALP